ncbi:hypothetical protein ETC05_16970 [Geobacillus sp. BMUD]|jgi:hypothetical protein|uniref:hypothetical protein n=1 Tax=Geobacillus sp. BMUD TaxID=2508876 RepID=UPI00149235D3|nr:hypothetical protein [Geobacillus sp. BMUD]NNU85416.1 hypothetical protein [Geobacillus sp. BMUD]
MRKLLLRRMTEEDTHMPGHGSTTSTPRWVKVSGIIASVLVLLFVIMMFIGGGKHGPGRHIPSSNGIEQGVKQP